MKLGRTREKSLQALTKKKLLEGVSICNIELSGHDILKKKTKVKFGTVDTLKRETLRQLFNWSERCLTCRHL